MWKRELAGIRAKQGKLNRLFLKILGFFLSLLIPIIIIGVIEYVYSAHMMEKEFTSRISTNLESAAETVDSYIQTSQITGVNFLFDETVKRLLMPKNEQDLETKAELWRIPRILQRHENVVSSFTDSTFVYIDNQDVYVSGGVNSFDFFFDKMYRYEAYNSGFWSDMLHSDKSIELLPITRVLQDNINMKQVVPIVMFSRVGNHNAVMVVNLSLQTIEKTLKGSTVFDSTHFVVLDGSGRMLYDGNRYLDSMTSAGLLASFENSDEAKEMQVDGKRYVIVHVKSDLYGWDYYSFTPYAEFNRHTFSILQMTLLLCLVLIVMGVVFSFIFSLRIYNPIRNIRDIIVQSANAGHVDNGENASEFELIRQGITRLSDSNRQYQVKHSKHTSEYVDYSLLFLLKGHTLNEEDILRETLKTDFGFDQNGFVCCTVFFDFKEAFYADIQDTERPLIMGGIKKIIWKLLADTAPAYVLEYRPNLFVCLVHVEGEGEVERLIGAFRRMLDVFGYDIRMYYDIAVGIGTFYSDVNEIRVSFNEAMTAVSKRSKDQRFEIIRSDRMCAESSYVYTLYDEQKILNFLKLADESAVRDVVEGIVDSNERQGISYEQQLQLYREMYTLGVRFMSEKGLNAAQTELGEFRPFDDAASEQQPFRGPDELRNVLFAFYAKIIETTRSQKGKKGGNLVSLIEQYIQDNYTQDLGLEQISDEMGVSVKYVSRVFIEKTGMYITDYINMIRVQKAKELLTSTDLRVNEIAEQVGIHSRTTFLRVFKKVEGITPNEYRTLQREEQ